MSNAVSALWRSPAVPLNPLSEVESIFAVLEGKAPGAFQRKSEGNQVAVRVDRERLVEVCWLLRDEPELECDLLVAETAVDWVDWLDVVYIVRSTKRGHELTFTVQVGREHPVVPSLANVWKAAIWMEREAYDLIGIQFGGHPDLRRVLTWDEFEGHPLRKDFGLGADTTAYDQVPPGYKKVGEQ